jgi:putative transposase
MIFAHKIALDLTQAQEADGRKAAGTARFTYNWGLSPWQEQYRNGEHPTAAGLKKQWNGLKYQEYPWLEEVHRDAHAHPFVNLHAAFQAFVQNVKDRKAGKTTRKVGYPTFKKKGQHDSFYIANDKVQVRGKRLRIPKRGWVRMREALRFPGKRLSTVISRTADRWYVSPACGFTDDRDFHAADNLEAYPRLGGNDNTCGHLSAGASVGGRETRVVEAGTTEGAHVRTF